MLFKSRPIKAMLLFLVVLMIASLAFWLLGEKPATFTPNTSFWAREMRPANPPLSEDLSTDVAIIGGGYTGLATAYHLKRYNPALNVVVLEAQQVGSGASGRHGGMLLPQPPTESFEIAESASLHQQTYALTARNLKTIQRICRDSGTECDLKLKGFVHAILDDEDIPYYREYVKQARQLGMPLEFWPANKTAARLGTDAYAAAVYDPNGGSVHAIKLINALKIMAERQGAVIYEHSRVNDIQEGPIITLTVGDQPHQVKAKTIVLATNAFTSKLGYFNYRVIPVHAQTAVTEPLTQEQLDSIAWKSRLPFYDSRNFLFHVVLRDDNRIVIGGGDAEYRFRGDLSEPGKMQRIHDLTMNELLKLYPSLQGIRFEAIWDGLLGMTADEVPLVGVTGQHQNIYYGLAYNGQGVNLSILFGDLIASLYSQRAHGWEATPYYAHHSGLAGFIPPEPYRWIGVKALMHYYKRQDQLSN